MERYIWWQNKKILKLDNKLVNRFPVLSVHWFYISLACWRQVYLTCLVGNVFTFLIYLFYSFVLWFFFHGKGLILIDIIKTSGTKRKSTMTHINFFEVVCGWSAIPVDISLNQKLNSILLYRWKYSPAYFRVKTASWVSLTTTRIARI